jgi:thiol-disulfide isomerase/thioredoxin
MGGETVLVDEGSGAVYRLDAVGTVVWSTFDGSADLGVLVKELADAFAADVEVVGRDVLDLTRTLAHIGLLTGVAPPVVHDQHHSAPVGTAEGDELPRFRLPGLDGATVDLGELRGGPVLLVNWSPGCGYCVMIAAELDALQADLAQRGTRLVLVAAGDAESNRALLADLDVDLPVVLRSGAGDDFVDPFPRMGTPAAYLLDAGGRVAAPLVSGAYQVPTLARRAAGRASASVPAAEGRAPARYAPGASDGMCGAGAGTAGGGGGTAAKPRPWTPTVAYRVGDYHLGIRADTPAAADVVRRFLAAHHAGDDPGVPVNFSVVLGDDGGDARKPARDLKILLQASARVIRSRSSRRVLAGLACFAAAYLPDAGGDVDAGLVRTRNLALIAGGEAVLLPPAVRGALEQLQPRVARFGAQVVDEPTALLDPARRELVVAEPALTLDRSVLDELADQQPSRSEPAAVAAGRYPLRAWALWDSGDPEAPELTPAEALTQALSTLAVPPGRLLAAADLLADLLAAAPPVLLATTGGEITDQLRPYLT